MGSRCESVHEILMRAVKHGWHIGEPQWGMNLIPLTRYSDRVRIKQPKSYGVKIIWLAENLKLFGPFNRA